MIILQTKKPPLYLKPCNEQVTFSIYFTTVSTIPTTNSAEKQEAAQEISLIPRHAALKTSS